MLVFLITLETEQGSLDLAENSFERAWRYIRVIQGHGSVPKAHRNGFEKNN
jgi:hypothetical protein